MSHQDSTRLIASLFRAKNEARPVLLLGAGCSFSSGVPLAAEGVKRVAKRVFAEKVHGGALAPEQLKLTEWQAWLQSHPWFIKGDDRLAENFQLVVEHLLVPREYRARVLLDLMEPVNGVGPGYRKLADLVMRGLAQTILTTNFDVCVPQALSERRPHIRHVAEVNRGVGDLNEFGLFNRAQLVWLHGKAEQYTDRNLADETARLDPKLVQLLVPLLTSSPLVVIGYRGAELSVMESLLLRNAKAAHRFKNGVYWCVLGGEPVHANVEALRRAIGRNFTIQVIDGFDELMADLSTELVGEDMYSASRSFRSGPSPVSFDDAPAVGATVSDLDQDLLLSVMREYCAKLGRAPVTPDTLYPLLREQGLLVKAESGSDVPTNGCVLLFGKDVQSRFPHAVVSGTVDGKKRQLFSGNLIQQRRQLLEWLEGQDVNPVLQVKRRTVHEERSAYEPRALVELVVNMLVHRDYELPEPGSIEVVAGDSVRFSNPGGLTDYIASRVTVDQDGHFRPLPSVSDLRNRALCDVFFGIRAMERAGTGLSDVETMARERGGDAEFSSDSRTATFTARLLQPPASAGSVAIARDRRPVGVYVLNVLTFASMPESISIVPCRARLIDRPREIALEQAGTFIHTAQEIWSFVPLARLLEVFGSFVDAENSRSEPLVRLEQDKIAQSRVSWLLRKHFQRYLGRFGDDGLTIEESRGRARRAYFVGLEGGPRTLSYDTPRRRGVQRQVVKQRSLAKPWFENEGFGFDIARVSGEWGVRVKPFYMFTGRDARTPVPSFVRTARATRRIKFDRNKNVEDDLTFWSRFLSRAEAAINIGQQHVADLLLEPSFMTIEVVEEGLLPDESKDRMPA